jgi:type I restriction enzyme S subunit
MENNIPDSWEMVKLVEQLNFLPTGVKEFSGTRKYYSTGSIQEDKNTPEGDFTYQNRPSRANRISVNGDVFQARMKATDKGILADDKLHDQLFSTGFIQLRPYGNTYNNKLLYYLIKSEQFLIQKNEYATGSTQEALTDTGASEIEIPLPPLAEQQRIVTKLDALFEKIECNKKRLDKIPVILKRFRQSVLAAAVSGKLTEDWREKNKMNNEWPSKQLDNIADVIDTHPSHRTPPTDENGVPYIGMGDIHDDGTIDFKNARRVSNSVLKEHINRYSISEGDFIFGKIGTIGKPIFIPTKRNYTISPNVILIKPKKDEVQYMYLYYYLNSAVFFEEVQLETKATSQPAYGIKKMRARVIPLPSISEQKIIINRVTLLMNYADKLEARYTKAKAMLDKLPQSILAKAFRGELVVQDPNDEPASVLLERIKEEKEILKPVKNTRKKK